MPTMQCFSKVWYRIASHTSMSLVLTEIFLFFDLCYTKKLLTAVIFQLMKSIRVGVNFLGFSLSAQFELSGKWGTGMQRSDHERGRRCTWRILRWRVGTLRQNARDWACYSIAVLLKTKHYAFPCTTARLLMLPWPSRSLLCSFWVRILNEFFCFAMMIGSCHSYRNFY